MHWWHFITFIFANGNFRAVQSFKWFVIRYSQIGWIFKQYWQNLERYKSSFFWLLADILLLLKHSLSMFVLVVLVFETAVIFVPTWPEWNLSGFTFSLNTISDARLLLCASPHQFGMDNDCILNLSCSLGTSAWRALCIVPYSLSDYWMFKVSGLRLLWGWLTFRHLVSLGGILLLFFSWTSLG